MKQGTVFGWTLTGHLKGHMENNASVLVCFSMITENSVWQLWDLETIGICEPTRHLSKRERNAEATRHFLKTVSRDPGGRYMVALPGMNGAKEAPEKVGKRLCGTMLKLKSLDMVRKYEKSSKLRSAKASSKLFWKRSKAWQYYNPNWAPVRCFVQVFEGLFSQST